MQERCWFRDEGRKCSQAGEPVLIWVRGPRSEKLQLGFGTNHFGFLVLFPCFDMDGGKVLILGEGTTLPHHQGGHSGCEITPSAHLLGLSAR